MKRLLLLVCVLVLWGGVPALHADLADDYHHLQQRIDDALLDIYGNDIPPQTIPELQAAVTAVRADLGAPAARALLKPDFGAASSGDGGAFSPQKLAEILGAMRGNLQHVAALEALEHQRAGRAAQAQAWRVMILLPQFANADDGGLLLHQPLEQVRQPGVTLALAREYVSWQVTRTRQLLDRLEHAIEADSVDAAFLGASLAEVHALSQFPEALLQAAELKNHGAASAAPPPPVLTEPYGSEAALNQLAVWRGKLEETLPNLLKPEDVTRLQRLLVRFVSVVPKEYHNGVDDGKVVIPLEYQEAVQFTQQAQGLVNELAPTWRRDLPVPFQKYHAELVRQLADLAKQIDQLASEGAVKTAANGAIKILQNEFGLSARRSGDKGQVVEETALDVREALGNSLAAAQAGHWQEAESLRLDAYTSFDSEIEVRVLPRDPTLARKTERSFIDGVDGSAGIKALLDRSAPIAELTAGYDRALKNMDACVAVLKVAVSPATVAFTAFTIIAREGLEAIVILAALLAGMRGEENKGTRRWVSSGAWLAIAASVLTFWLSKTLIQSLARYGKSSRP